MKFEVDQKVVEGLIKYLSTRPWREVNDGITALHNLKPTKSCPQCEKKRDEDDAGK